MILETVVTTRNPDGSINVAPMGPCCDDLAMDTFELRPFDSSQTGRNLQRTGQGVLHITDDVLLFVHAAIGGRNSQFKLLPSEKVDVDYLADCCRCLEFETTWIEQTSNRATIRCRTVYRRRIRDFIGFHRARHAVIEACILATRVEFIPKAEIEQQFRELRKLVDRTGDEPEQEAFATLERYVASCAVPSTESPVSRASLEPPAP